MLSKFLFISLAVGLASYPSAYAVPPGDDNDQIPVSRGVLIEELESIKTSPLSSVFSDYLLDDIGELIERFKINPELRHEDFIAGDYNEFQTWTIASDDVSKIADVRYFSWPLNELLNLGEVTIEKHQTFIKNPAGDALQNWGDRLVFTYTEFLPSKIALSVKFDEFNSDPWYTINVKEEAEGLDETFGSSGNSESSDESEEDVEDWGLPLESDKSDTNDAESDDGIESLDYIFEDYADFDDETEMLR